MGWNDYDDDDEKPTEFEREYEFFISGEPNILCDVSGFKVLLPVSELGLVYDRSEMVNHSWTYQSDPSHENTETDVKANSIRLIIVKIKGISVTPYNRPNWSEIIKDIKSLKKREIKEGNYFNLCTQSTTNKIKVCEEEYKYREIEICVSDLLTLLDELKDSKKEVKKGIKKS